MKNIVEKGLDETKLNKFQVGHPESLTLNSKVDVPTHESSFWFAGILWLHLFFSL